MSCMTTSSSTSLNRIAWSNDVNEKLSYMTVYVRTISGKTISIRCDKRQSITRSRDEIERKTKIPKALQHFSKQGKTPTERKTIQEHNIMNETTLEMTLGLQGGMKEDEMMTSARSAWRQKFQKKTQWNRWNYNSAMTTEQIKRMIYHASRTSEEKRKAYWKYGTGDEADKWNDIAISRFATKRDEQDSWKMKEDSDDKCSIMKEKSPRWKTDDHAGRSKRQRKRDESERHGRQQETRRPEPEKSRSDRTPRRHDRTRSTRHIEGDHDYNRNVNGSNSDRLSSQADHTWVLAVHRQRRMRHVCQNSEHIEERVERTDNKDITSHGCRRNISTKKIWVFAKPCSYKTQCTIRADHSEQLDKTCMGRRTDSDQNMCKWISQVPQIWRIETGVEATVGNGCHKTRRNDCEQSNCGNQTPNGRDDYVLSRWDKDTQSEQEYERVREKVGADRVSNTTTVTFQCACILKKMLNLNWRRLKEREEKAEADNVVVSLKKTYQCVCETKLKKMKRDQNKTKKGSSNRLKCKGGIKKTKTMRTQKAKVQAAAALKQVRQQVRQTVRSLTSSERIEELTQEVEGCRWDAKLISETWRSSNAEIWETQQGHIFMGAGKFKNKHGVGILLNKKWRKRINWTDYISERAISTSITVNKQHVLLMSVYVTHSGYADHHVKNLQIIRETHEIQKEEHTNCVRSFQCWIGTRVWCWTCQCRTAYPQRGEQERGFDAAVVDDSKFHGTWHDVWNTHYK